MHTHTHMHMHMHTRMHITYANAYHICISHMHMHITYAHAYNICTCLSHTHVCTPTASMALARLLDGLLLPGENLGAVGIPFVDHVLHRGWRARLRVWVGGAALGVAIACTSVRASFFPTSNFLLPYSLPTYFLRPADHVPAPRSWSHPSPWPGHARSCHRRWRS
jgi:hypothetical protein